MFILKLDILRFTERCTTPWLGISTTPPGLTENLEKLHTPPANFTPLLNPLKNLPIPPPPFIPTLPRLGGTYESISITKYERLKFDDPFYITSFLYHNIYN